MAWLFNPRYEVIIHEVTKVTPSSCPLHLFLKSSKLELPQLPIQNRCFRMVKNLFRNEETPIKIRFGRDGIHYFDRQSGLNILMDEVHVPIRLHSRAPQFCSFALTNLCDLDCTFCYAPKTPARIDFDHVLKWSLELDDNGALGVGFGGGEPTLYPRFAELCRTLANSTALAISFTTHAHRFTSQLRDELTGNVNFIRVSMDGVDDTYERIRRRPFSRFLEQLKIVSDTCAFGINYVVNDVTIHELDKAADFVASVGASELLLLPEYSASGLASSTRKSLEEWMSENSGRARLSISETGVTDGITLADPFVNEKGTRAYIHVSATGRVSRTSYSQNAAVAISTDAGILAAIAELEGECA